MSKLTRIGRAVLIATLALVSTGALKALVPNAPGTNFFNDTINGVNLGDASGGATLGHKSWAIFALSGGVTITDPSYNPLSPDVYGNVAIAGSGALSMTASYIQGGITVQNNAQVTPVGPVYYSGARTVDATLSSGAGAQAIAASNTASSLGNSTTGLTFTGAFTSVPSTISLSAGTGTEIISGAAGTTYVLNLLDLIVSGTSLTLNGTSTTNYIFNVSRFLTLSNGAAINLGGSGITEANILFNVKTSAPQYDVNLSGGSVVHGIILAKDRAVKETGASMIIGEVIAKGVSLSGVSKVINPFASP